MNYAGQKATMRTYHFYQIDVFTEHKYGGNPLGVFPDAAGLSDEEMQLIAFELNLSETTFVFPPQDARANHKVRIFTPVMEVPFAGHPTIGTHFLLAELGRFELHSSPTRVLQELSIGVLPVDIEHENGRVTRVTMTQAQPHFLSELADLDALAQALRCRSEVFDVNFARPQVVSTGLPFLMIPVASLDALKELSVDAPLLRTLCEQHGCKMAYAFARETFSGSADVHARFLSGHLEFEDPATGSAAGALSAFLVRNGVHGRQDDNRFLIEQGHFIKRPSLIQSQVIVHEGEIEKVLVSGSCCRVFEGDFEV